MSVTKDKENYSWSEMINHLNTLTFEDIKRVTKSLNKNTIRPRND